MENAIVAKGEPALAKAGARKKPARPAWTANDRMGRASRVWSKADFEKLAAPPENNVIRPVHGFGRLSAVSPAMQEVFDMLARFARTHVTLTLLGETGTGKDVLAQALHVESARATGPFVVFDCGAVAANLAESELLGHERGAFTGAVASYAGAFERANGGTLFLDEIGELPIDLQPRLLRVLESRRVRRVGGTQDRQLDVRIICATHRDLRADVAATRFRQDLYFRLAAAVIAVPPLRARLEDLSLLVPSLLEDLGHGNLRIGPGALEALRAHPWPGNVRELKNALACAAAFVDGSDVLEPHHLRLISPEANELSGIERLPLGGQTLEQIERVAIKQTMAQTDGNKVHAAQALGIAVSTLYEKLKKYRL
jgi:transcriptional regulator with PAS, ATPase and Fis domain